MSNTIKKLIYNKNIKLILANKPSEKIACYDEVILWMELGWIDEIIKNKHEIFIR